MIYKPQKYPNSLRKYRKSLGLRQDDVARLIGLKTKERISKWETGVHVPCLHSLIRLSNLYKVSLRELYAETYEIIEHPERVKPVDPNPRETRLVRMEDEPVPDFLMSAGRHLEV